MEWAFRKYSQILILTFLCVCTAIGCSKGEPPPSIDKLLRISDYEGGHSALEVISARYEPEVATVAGQHVDFIGAVHLGEESYFAELNERFKQYDVVLFELVGDPSRIKEVRTQSRLSVLGSVQKKLAEILGLAFQLEKIDYSAANFVHADMTAEQLADAFTTRGESVFDIVLKLIKLSFDTQLENELKANGYSAKELEGINPLMILLRGPTAEERISLKKFMAAGLMSSDKVLKALEGDIGSVLIADRNKVVVSALKEQLRKGVKNIAVYYGGGHLPDMDARFKSDLRLKLSAVWWNRAWNLK